MVLRILMPSPIASVPPGGGQKKRKKTPCVVLPCEFLHAGGVQLSSISSFHSTTMASQQVPAAPAPAPAAPLRPPTEVSPAHSGARLLTSARARPGRSRRKREDDDGGFVARSRLRHCRPHAATRARSYRYVSPALQRPSSDVRQGPGPDQAVPTPATRTTSYTLGVWLRQTPDEDAVVVFTHLAGLGRDRG
jgi:hypothetical protein